MNDRAYQRTREMSEHERTINCLVIVPAGDLHYKLALKRATMAELEVALGKLRSREQSKSKIAAIEREIRRRECTRR